MFFLSKIDVFKVQGSRFSDKMCKKTDFDSDMGLESMFDRSLDNCWSHFGSILLPKTDLKTIEIFHRFLDGPLGGERQSPVTLVMPF